MADTYQAVLKPRISGAWNLQMGGYHPDDNVGGFNIKIFQIPGK